LEEGTLAFHASSSVFWDRSFYAGARLNDRTSIRASRTALRRAGARRALPVLGVLLDCLSKPT
jgi:hypothetical protein